MVDLSIYTLEYFHRRLRADRQRAFDVLAEVVCSRLTFESFVDVGCATGDLTSRLLDAGKHGVGVELAPAAFMLMAKDVGLNVFAEDATDTNLPAKLGRFDLAICLEVAEHIPTAKSRALIENLCQLAGLVLFSAAPPGQGGTGHVNEQSWDYWQRLFSAEGFVEDVSLGRALRDDLASGRARRVYVDNTRVMRAQHGP
jgi:2-polyprenyl-3-methyl-5-hydroxy-6-metoxy-1,4-benzoquinol methylase